MVVVKNLPTNSISSLSNRSGELLYDSTINHPVINNNTVFKKFVLSNLDDDVTIGRNLTVTGPILAIPTGNTAGRPATPAVGYIRYNSQTSQFEGFGAGNAWGSLGGVNDVNQDTKILAEDGAGTNDDNLRFFNNGNENMRLTATGTLGIGTTNPDKKVEINSSSGDCLRLTYNDANGSASNYVDLLVSSSGDLSITPSGNDLDITTHNGTTQGLKLGGVLLTATAAQLNDIVSGSGTSSFNTANVTGNLTISNHDGATTGLVLGSTLVTSTATELNYLDTTPGTAEASKALVLDSSRNITNINNFNTTKLTTDGSTYSEILTSWTPQTSIANNTWKAFAYSPSLDIYVAISNNSANTSSFASSPDGLTWTTRTAPAARSWNDVIWVEDFSWFVAVSNATSNTGSSFAYSANGTTWTGVSAPANRNFINIIYNKYQRLFLASSSDSTTDFSYRSNIFTSSWTVSKNTFTYTNAPVIYVAQLSKYLTMRDGNTSTTADTLWFEFGSSWNTWQEFTDRSWGNLPTSLTVKAYKNVANSPELGIIVAVATDISSAVQSIAYSTNLSTWTYGNAADAGSWFKIIWAAEVGLFVSISSDSTPKIMKSTNGINWSLVTYSGSLTTLSDIKWVPELSSFFLVSSVSGSTYTISSSSMLSSTNITFIKNPQNSNLKSSITGGAFVNLNAGLAGSFRWMNMPTSTTLSNEIMRLSTTGLSINSPQSSTAALDIKPVTLNNNKVLRLRSSNGTYAYDFSLDTSGNLTTTHSANFTTSITMDHPVKIGNSAFVNSTAYNTGQLVVFGGMGVQGRIYTGDTMYPASLNIQDSYLYATLGNAFYNVDELSTTYGITGGTVPARTINNFAWSPQLKLFVCTTGSNGIFLYSSDGLAWSTASTALNRTWDGICWADKLGLFVAIANDTGSNTGMIATSANGISWSAQNGPSTSGTNWTSITWSPTLNLLVACASVGSQTGGIMYSSNGTSWTLATIPSTTQTNSNFRKIIWNPTLNQFVACGYGQFAVSSNGITWNLYNTSTATQQFSSVEYSPTVGLYVASHTSNSAWGASSTDGITWTTTNIPPFVDIMWIPRVRAFIGTSGYFVSYDNWSTNGTTWNTLQRSLQNGGYYNWKLGYSPDLEMVVIGRIGSTGVNQNIIMSKTLSYTNLNIGRNYAYSRDNRTSIKMDTHLIYTSGFNSGHRWYNSLVDSQQNGQNLLMALDTDGLAIGRTIPQAKLDIQIPSAGEIIRFRTSEYNTASFGIDANARITMSHSTLTSPYTSSSDYGFIIQNNNTAGTNVSAGLLFKYKNSAGNYFNASGILPYGLTNTASSETTGIRFYNTLSGSYFNSFSLLASGGCNTIRSSSGTIHSFSIGSGGDGSYGDLAIEGNSSTWLRLRATYQSTNNLAKLDFINRYDGSDTTSFTLTPTGSNGGNITNVNNITINGGINNLATGTYNDFGNTRFNYASIFGRQWRVYSSNSLMYVRYSNTGISSNTFSQPDNYCAEFGNGDFSSLAQVTSGCFELEGFITTDYTETYTFTFVSTYTKFRIWLDGKLVAQDWSANASTSPTTTFNGTAGKKVSFYAQIASGDLSTSSNNTFVLKWQSNSRSYQTIPASKMEGTFTGRMVNRTPYSVANQLTLYNTTSNSSSSNKSEFLVDSSGNTLIKSSGSLVSIDASNSLDIASHDGSSVGLKLGGSLVTSTATELNYLDTTPGTAEASKALVLDSNLDIVGIHNIETDNLTVNGTLVTSSAVELNYVDVTTIGVAQASKALVLDENLEIVGIHNIETDNLTVNGTLVTSSAIELNYVDVASIGVAEASKALVVDSNRDITNINQLATTGLVSTLIANDNASNINYQTWTNDLATDMVTALQMNNIGLDFGTTSNHPLALTTNNVERVSIDTSGNVDLINHDGSSVGLKLGGTLVTAMATELNYVDTTVGAAEASKALVLDASRNITNINEFATTGLLSTVIANDNASNINYQTWTNDLATDIITSLQMNNVGLDFGTTSNHPLALTTNNVERLTIDTSGNVDLINHNGSSVGLTLGGTLVTATATEINYVDTTVGAAEASKALVLDASRNITNINEFATTGLLSTVIANDNASNINYQTWTNDLATDIVTALQMNNVGLDFGTTSNHPLALTTNNIERVSLDTYGNIDLIYHDGSTVGLTLGGTLVTATATEINYVDTTVGAAEASKALVLDASRNITNINEFATTGLLSTVIANDNTSNINYQTWTNNLATDMVTALQMSNVGLDFGTTSNHPLALTTNNVERLTIDTSGNVNLVDHDGSTVGLTLGGTLVTATATELNYVDTTQGTAEASKALVLDSSRNINNINNLYATILNATIVDGTGNSVSYPVTINSTTSSTPANGLGCGIAFYIENSNNQSSAYGSIEVSADDITDNSEDGKLKINLLTGGVNSTALTLTKESLLVEEVVETSDRRVKENIVSADIKDSYEKIMALHLVNFNFIHDTNKRVHRGVIAQEVNKIIPSAVHINENENLDDFHSISTKELVGYIIGSLQHMNQKYNELEKKYNELEKKYNELEK